MKRLTFFTVLTCLSFISLAQKVNDTTAIRLLLEKESATWRSGDVKGHAECWHVQPYSRILVSTADGNTIDVPPIVMINPPATMVGQGGYAINSNYKMSISKNTAWVSHHEESVAKDGKKSFSYEIRLLEKIKGQWKLVGQSIHMYKPI
ncbi:MAG: hypothetical protein RIR12_1570 [Bacteroidota bacterium]|jgi:hypothetical protein